MEKEAFQICEWQIENFSCWNNKVHGDSFYSPTFFLKYVQTLELYPRSALTGEIVVLFFNGKVIPSSGGNVSFIDSDGSNITTKRTHTDGWEHKIKSGLTFEEVASKIKNKGDRLTVRLCFLSDEALTEAVSTTLDVLNVSLKMDPKSIVGLESGESKSLSLIRYSKKSVLDELMLKAVRKGKTVEFVLELLTKTAMAVSVESQWSLQCADKTSVRKEEKKYLFSNCESWKFSNSLIGELMDDGITMNLNLKITNGDIIGNKLSAPLDISTTLKKTVLFFEQDYFKHQDSSSKTGDSVAALTNDILCLYQDQDFSDVQIKCDGVSFPVHKNILSARSPVFKSMFSTDMTESASGLVVVEDLDPSTLSLFLTYLYTGVVEDLQSDTALMLYYAADKYQVPSLKGVCADFIRSRVSISNVCDILLFADQHRDDDLTAVAYSFVANHFNQVLESKEWMEFMEVQPLLAVKTVTQLAQKNQVGKI